MLVLWMLDSIFLVQTEIIYIRAITLLKIEEIFQVMSINVIYGENILMTRKKLKGFEFVSLRIA